MCVSTSAQPSQDRYHSSVEMITFITTPSRPSPQGFHLGWILQWQSVPPFSAREWKLLTQFTVIGWFHVEPNEATTGWAVTATNQQEMTGVMARSTFISCIPISLSTQAVRFLLITAGAGAMWRGVARWGAVRGHARCSGVVVYRFRPFTPPVMVAPRNLT